jgi:hypothetical protein
MAFLKNYFRSADISRGMNNLASTRVRGWSGGVVPFQPLIENPGRLGTAERQLPTLGFPRATNHQSPVTVSSVQCWNGVALLAAPMQVVHRNVEVYLAARRLDADH